MTNKSADPSINLQKQPPEVFQKRCSLKLRKIYKKTPVSESPCDCFLICVVSGLLQVVPGCSGTIQPVVTCYGLFHVVPFFPNYGS